MKSKPNKQKLWRTEARQRNIEDGRKHRGRVYKNGPKTPMSGYLYPRLRALFERIGLINKEMPSV
jgi:hypothetical protein